MPNISTIFALTHPNMTVQRVCDWPYSTFHCYVVDGVLPVDWCGDPADPPTVSFVSLGGVKNPDTSLYSGLTALSVAPAYPALI